MSREKRSEGDQTGRMGRSGGKSKTGFGLGFGSNVVELPRNDTNVENRVVTGGRETYYCVDLRK